MNGPFPAGKSDLKIFKEDGLKAMITAKKKMCIADGGMLDQTISTTAARPVYTTVVQLDSSKQGRSRDTRSSKNFHSVDCRFRHSIDKFKSAFGAICVICQYQIETDKPLYHVLVEDVLLEDELE
ncbi:hypothetical protein IV203_033306 [Nitzschia inconspicua]|uniref:Uncharacterized protein n=1 Tax=Nitzschia inconspicua TaxID=303405 RepID=A0A9K3PFX8_9STRA|nr:hypothetical protein IV203_033306 [Nitzschia inconspicua]